MPTSFDCNNQKERNGSSFPFLGRGEGGQKLELKLVLYRLICSSKHKQNAEEEEEEESKIELNSNPMMANKGREQGKL